MNEKIRIALAQVNTTVGDIPGNTRKILDYIDEAKRKHVDIVVFPELAVTGYPPEDLLFKPQFITDSVASLNRIIPHTDDIVAILGFVDQHEARSNAAAVIHDRNLVRTYAKIHLPNYDVFDEQRYFRAGNTGFVFEYRDVVFGVNICEDIWMPDSVTEDQVRYGGAQFVFNISASPFHYQKVREREDILIDRARKNGIYIFYVNLVGGQDELVFDGHSLIVADTGKFLLRGAQFKEELIVFDLDPSVLQIKKRSPMPETNDRCDHDIEIVDLGPIHPHRQEVNVQEASLREKLSESEEIYQALVLGTRDYLYKNGFKQAVLGLSGGIDSALTAVIAAEAIGPESVIGVMMPSRFSSPGSITDSELLAKNLEIRTYTVPIQQTFEVYKQMLRPIFNDSPEDITEENIQARIRGNILMALSNKYGWLPLTTGNKSELSVGYCTLYGDMSGGYAVIKDVPKTLVYKLSDHINATRGREIIPRNIIIKPPSAELRPDQKDEDSLPPYDVLDPILNLYIEKDFDANRIVQYGYDEALVRRIIRMVDRSEYKRRQAPPGVKISPKAFGKDRRMPITNRYH
ncbi:NAD+ synthase [candidate division KSB1 bacterium]|nr:NAD+ synthase [candidate division KSB1 bacterium]